MIREQAEALVEALEITCAAAKVGRHFQSSWAMTDRNIDHGLSENPVVSRGERAFALGWLATDADQMPSRPIREAMDEAIRVARRWCGGDLS